MKNLYYFLIIYSIILGSCSKQGSVENKYTHLLNETIALSSDNHKEGIQLTKIHGDLRKYASLAVAPDVLIGISSSRRNTPESETIMAFYNPIHDNERPSLENKYMYDVQVNGKRLFSPKTRSGDGFISGLFGNYISFNFSKSETFTKSSKPEDEEKEDDSIGIYLPEIMKIEFPNKALSDEERPLCYYKNFIVRWNQDKNNSNGIIIIVEWNGIMVFGEDYPASVVQHIVRFPDTGTAELDESIFEGIPDAAYCTLHFFRGDVEDVEINETNYRFLSACHDALDFVLIRHIK